MTPKSPRILYMYMCLYRDLFAEILAEEVLYGGKGDDVLPVVEVGVACAGNDHEKLVVLLAGSYGQLLVCVAAEVERMGFLSMKNHYGILDLAGTAHQRKVYPGNRGCGVSSAVGVERAGMITALGLIIVVVVAEELWRIVGNTSGTPPPSLGVPLI